MYNAIYYNQNKKGNYKYCLLPNIFVLAPAPAHKKYYGAFHITIDSFWARNPGPPH